MTCTCPTDAHQLEQICDPCVKEWNETLDGQMKPMDYYTAPRGKTIVSDGKKINAFWYNRDETERTDGKLPTGRWKVDSIGECGPGGEFYVVWQNSPFRMAYVPLTGVELV